MCLAGLFSSTAIKLGGDAVQAEQFVEILQQSLDDERLSRSEKQAIEKVLADEKIDPSKLAEFRSLLFDQARLAMHDHRDAMLLDWLEKTEQALAARTCRSSAKYARLFFAGSRL